MTETERTITEADAGTWLSGSMGWHNTYRVIDVARDYGFAVSPEDMQAVRRYADGDLSDQTDTVFDLSAEATDYLQTLAPEGYAFDWDAGELNLIKIDEEDDA